MRRYASAVYAVVVCMSVRLSHAGIAQKIAEHRITQRIVLDVRTQNGDEPVGEITFPGQSCLSSANSC